VTPPSDLRDKVAELRRQVDLGFGLFTASDIRALLDALEAAMDENVRLHRDAIERSALRLADAKEIARLASLVSTRVDAAERGSGNEA
jgi:hypothetical protein